MTPPVFGHGHLRLYVLRLLEEAPRHGYDLIRDLGDRFGGTYVPSAGTIYPRLAKLEEDGLVTRRSEGRKTVYVITDAGRAELAARRSELDGIEEEVTDSVRRLAAEVRSSVNDAMRSLRADLAAAAADARRDARAGGRARRPDAHAEPTDAQAERSGPHAEHADPRAESRALLQRAEAALTDFRTHMRAELRTHVVSGALSEQTVQTLAEGLADVRRRVLQTLRD